MSYFDPKIYCKQNLKEEHRRELDYYWEFVKQGVEYAVSEFTDMYDSGSGILDKLVKEIADTLKDEILTEFGNRFQYEVVGYIDDYDEDVEVEEYDEPENYFYESEDDEEEEDAPVSE